MGIDLGDNNLSIWAKGVEFFMVLKKKKSSEKKLGVTTVLSNISVSESMN